MKDIRYKVQCVYRYMSNLISIYNPFYNIYVTSERYYKIAIKLITD